MVPDNDGGTHAATAALFGDLWHRFDDELFEKSVALFGERFKANGFDLAWFCGKRCLDVGCGGGRYTVAMARLGAAAAYGADISEAGLKDAARRTGNVPNASFLRGSALELPFRDGSLDFVCCSGVLHHTPDAARGLAEIVRVIRPGGKVYLLLYGKGGLRWPTIMACRPHAQSIGYGSMDKAIRLAGLPANKQRTFLDDLFVPLIDFYSVEEVRELLDAAGLHDFERWERGKHDHESSVGVQREELEQLKLVFDTVSTSDDEDLVSAKPEAGEAALKVGDAIARLDAAEVDFDAGWIDRTERDVRVFGVGHHRILATKP